MKKILAGATLATLFFIFVWFFFFKPDEPLPGVKPIPQPLIFPDSIKKKADAKKDTLYRLADSALFHYVDSLLARRYSTPVRR